MFEGKFKAGYWYNPRTGLWTISNQWKEQFDKSVYTSYWPENNIFDTRASLRLITIGY
jgi:hypothetical protein